MKTKKLLGVALGLALGSAFGTLAALPALAQEQEPEQEEESSPHPLPPIFDQPEVDPTTAELQRLFQEVERNLKRIDDMLYDAGAGDLPLDEVEDSGLDDLLRRTQEESQAAVNAIDEILQLAQQRRQQQQQSGGGGGGQQQQPQPGGPSPLDEQRDQGPRRNEDTPEGMRPDQQGEEQDQPQPQDGNEPESPTGDDRSGENRSGQKFSQEQGDPGAAGRDTEEWGMLPGKVQEIFRNEGTEDLPVQYRDWIDAYYRRLNEADAR